VILLALAAGVLGLLIGSFLNVVIYRVPNGRSIVSPPSACPHCGHEIAWYDNVPVVSWLILRAKCRNCGAPISARYPLVELGTGVAFGLVAWHFGGPILDSVTTPAIISATLVLVAYLYFAAVSVALSLIDLDTHRLPDAIVLPSYIVAIVLLALASLAAGEFWPLLRAGAGMAALVVAYFLMAFIYPPAMGMGDVKLAGVLGLYLAWIGWGALLVGALAAFILGGVFGVILIIAKRANRKSGIPFGPWMLLGAWVGVAFGTVAFNGYLTFVGFPVA